jgi:hypothetical protein
MIHPSLRSKISALRFPELTNHVTRIDRELLRELPTQDSASPISDLVRKAQIRYGDRQISHLFPISRTNMRTKPFRRPSQLFTGQSQLR